jgi:hypothetical protein
MYKSYADVCRQIRAKYDEVCRKIEKMEDQGVSIPESLRREHNDLLLATRGCFR